MSLCHHVVVRQLVLLPPASVGQKRQPVCILIRLSLSNLSFSVSSHPYLRTHLPCLFSSADVISFMLPYCFQSSFTILSIFFSFTLFLLNSPFPSHHFIRFIIFFLFFCPPHSSYISKFKKK